MRLWLLLGLCGLVTGYITCPDGRMKCNDEATCCLTERGYQCCPYPNAVCCSDLAHCCPYGYFCNMVTQMCEKRGEPWNSVPLGMKDSLIEDEHSPTAIEDSDNKLHVEKPSIVYCDNYFACPDGTTCCRHPKGGWTCCPYSPGHCCLDGYHCCPWGYDCDYTYTHCVRQGLRFPFSPRTSSVSEPASPISADETPLTALKEGTEVKEEGGIRCDSQFYCPKGSSCCKGSKGQWNCCPYPLGQCCADGLHCCQYGYTCDPQSQMCRGLFTKV